MCSFFFNALAKWLLTQVHNYCDVIFLCVGFLRLIAEVNIFQHRTRFSFSLFFLYRVEVCAERLIKQHLTNTIAVNYRGEWYKKSIHLSVKWCNLCRRDSENKA